LIERFAGDQRSQSHVAAILADLNDQRSMVGLLLLAAKSGIEAPFIDQWIKAIVVEQKLDVVEQASMLARQFTNQQQKELARTLVDDRESIAVLVALGEAGSISPEVMLDKNVWERLAAVADAELLERAEVVRGLAKPVDDAIRSQMDDVVQLLTQQLDDDKTDIQRGRTAYTQHCAICHQIAGQGEVVGPQLDGVGGRGAARLVEDILTPDRNADAAFRTTTLVTVDGTVVNGLVRNENADQIVIVGQDGKPITIAMDDIELRRQGTTSLMPGNFHETLGTEGIAAVIAYLIEAAPQK
jgi:putative heme-binding domain-containing protein